ncbi:MAG TPA: sigma 54-interacting transcriptional regulator [Polyangiaceae bacterium]|jgi:transcriptional regulator with GAF, ATPase, and Fis domain|nr:sigma 54-interacting transcriptional regulator [Polyangiaceae bacterium]
MSSRDDPETRTVMQVAAAAPAESGLASFSLYVVEGPDAGARYELDANHPSRILVGKSEACEVRLSDPSVSRRHLSLAIDGRRLHVQDLDSTNGTIADGVALVEGYLRGDELLRVGSTALRVERGTRTTPVQFPPATRFGGVLGASEAMRRLYPLCERLAQATFPVVIEGETGTGKEQLAESMHQQSPRHAEPFVVFDCTAVAASVIESELFGHVRGAFTGAVSDRQGVFERAHGGTLLIDEIGDLPPELQPKLLRAIERGQVTRVGGDLPLAVDVRLLAATRRNLDREVQLGRFRDDLFHRVAVARIELPPLRARKGDIPMLARHFWSQLGGDPSALPVQALRRWEDDDWPGNVRQLRNAVQRLFALGDFPEPAEQTSVVLHTTSDHGDWLGALLALDLPFSELRDRTLLVLQERYLQRLLEAHGGDTARAAAAAGMSRRSLQRLLARISGKPE